MSHNDMLPCRACGVASDRDIRWYETGASAANGVVRPAMKFQASTCEACESLRFNEPGYAVRACLRVLGRPETDDALYAGVLTDENLDAAQVLFQGGAPNSSPWRHVPNEFRCDLRRAYSKALIRKVEASLPREATPPPYDDRTPDIEPACGACGVAEAMAWYGPIADLARGNRRVRYVLCPACTDALVAHGALGKPMIERAYLTSLGLKADVDEELVGLKPWYETGLPPQGKPWAWVAPPESSPPIETEATTVEALAARVATLQAELALMRGAQG